MVRRMTAESRAVLADARAVAVAEGSPTLEAEHLLLAVARSRRAGAGRVLAEAGLDEEGVRDALDSELAATLAEVGVSLAAFDLTATPDRSRTPRWGTSATLALTRSNRIAESRRDRRFTAGHLVLGVLRAPAGTVPRALDRAGVDRPELCRRVAAML